MIYIFKLEGFNPHPTLDQQTPLEAIYPFWYRVLQNRNVSVPSTCKQAEMPEFDFVCLFVFYLKSSPF